MLKADSSKVLLIAYSELVSTTVPENIIVPAIRKPIIIINMNLRILKIINTTKSREISLNDFLKVANSIPNDGKKAFNILMKV